MWAVILPAAALVVGTVIGWMLRGRQLTDMVDRMRRATEAETLSLRSRLESTETAVAAAQARFEASEAARQAAAIEHNIGESLLGEAREARTAALKELALAKAEGAKAAAAAEEAHARHAEVSAELAECQRRLQTAAAGSDPQKVLVDLRAEAPADPDPLQRIGGIDPVLEELLLDLGIRTFRQIATLSDDDVASIERALDALPGRIAREKWREQARALIAEVGV